MILDTSVLPAAYKSEIVKSGTLKCREEPPKLLQGNKFQERTFQIQEHRLLLLRDKKVQPPSGGATNRRAPAAPPANKETIINMISCYSDITWLCIYAKQLVRLFPPF